MGASQVITADDGRAVRVYDGGGPSGAPALLWHHGSPQTGALLDPVLVAAAEHDLRVVSFARPSYGGSGHAPGRSVSLVAHDAAAVARALDLTHVIVLGHSGGGPHALACAAVMPDRVIGVGAFACPAPLPGHEADWWFEGMSSDAALRRALEGRAARAAFAETDEFDPSSFIASDWATLEGPWGQMGEDAGLAEAEGTDGLVDDDVALVTDWGVDLARVVAPTVLVHGDGDRVIPVAHAHHLASSLPDAELWVVPGAGHLAVLEQLPQVLDRLLERRSAG